MKLSIIIGTGRETYGAMKHDPTEHLFKRTFSSLNAQTCPDFEVIIADSCHAIRDLEADINTLGTHGFEWKVVKPTSWWLEQGMWQLQHAFNVAAKVSIGDCLIFCGDCCEFEPDMVARVLEIYKQGYAPHLLYLKKWGDLIAHEDELSGIKGAATARDLTPAQWKKAIKDSRFPFVENGILKGDQCFWQWFYGYCCIPRHDFFSVNGWDEAFDGEKSLGDVEMGSRLQMCGRLKMYLDKSLVCYEQLHNEICTKIFPKELLTDSTRSNYDLIWLMRIKGITRANSTRYTYDECWKVIRGIYTGITNWPIHVDNEGNPRHKYQKHWVENHPVFTL